MHSNYRGAQEWRDLGLPLTTGSDEACKMYDALLSQTLSFKPDDNLGGIEGTLNRMKQADPDFVMGQVINNWLDLFCNSRLMHRNDGLAEDIAKMKMLADKTPGITQWERKHVHAIDLWSQGYQDKATTVWESILIDHPYDVGAISMAFMTYLYRGKSFQLRDSLGRVLPHWKPSMPYYGSLLSRHAFGMEETNLYPQAEKTVREALSMNPRDAWSTHTLSHVLERLGRQQELIDTLEKTQGNWQFGENLACHNYWHWGINAVEMSTKMCFQRTRRNASWKSWESGKIDKQGDYETALSIFDDQLSQRWANTESSFNLSDCCSLLYRLEFEGAPIEDRWHNLKDAYKKKTDNHVYCFYDLGTYMMCLNSREEGLAEKMMESMQEFIRNGKGDNRDTVAEVGEKVMKALTAYQDGDYAGAVDFLFPVRYRIRELGGSNAQRDLFHLFLIQSAIRSPKKGHNRLARNLLNERKSVVPHSPMTDRLMAKVIEAHDD